MKRNLIFLVLLISCGERETDDYLIADKSSTIAIYLDGKADDLIKWAVNDLVDDLEKMTAKKVEIFTTEKFKVDNKGIYISVLTGNLAESLPENFKPQLQNQWEKFIIKKHNDNLFLVGSDIRGTVYAIFELAERIGISPWKWWADVSLPLKDSIMLRLPDGGVEEGPSVQYRGIFLNDEDWGLQPWAAKTFEPETGDIGPKTYEKIFQLLLRLKANTIWPAMHPSTTAFYRIQGNREMAKKYHISIGTSHAEPMLRNNVGEWDQEVNGDFNYFTNSDKVKEYWRERISETQNDNCMITLGMRGIHDSGMEGNATMEDKVEMLEKIISDQRKILTRTMNKPIEEIPQVFTPYKEVLSLYRNGLMVPDDVTLMWTDDNYGYMRRLSNKEEQERKGGSGVYYHLSYWGRPHDYLWLSTTQPGLIWYELSRAYQNGAQKIWIANVGDIKPGEYATEFFLDLAWDINSINENTIKKHLEQWSTREFGGENSKEIANVMQEFYRLAFLRKPEFMGWSQVEPITETRISQFYNNEIDRRIEAYSELISEVENIKSFVSKDRIDAYFQLIEYPVKAAAFMNHKFLFAQQSLLTGNGVEKNKLANQSENAYKQIITLSEKYNSTICNGKWKEIISMQPRNLPVFDMPSYHLSDTTQIVNHTENKQEEMFQFMRADEFSKAFNVDNYKWKIIEGLGYGNASVTLFPLDSHLFVKEVPYLEYTFNINNTGKYNIEVRCIPTHSNNYDHQVSIEVNSEEATPYLINTKGRSESWKENVLRNFVPVTHTVTFEKSGAQSLKIYANQTGIVFDQIAISSVKQQGYYEIANQ